MDPYLHYVNAELGLWLQQMKKKSGLFGNITHGVQSKINEWIPDKVHKAITLAIENMVKVVIKGSSWIRPKAPDEMELKVRELKIRNRIKWYRNTASAEGAVTGAGGILLGFADFPAFLTIKMKMLFDIAALYGFDTRDYQERLFLLYVFQLSFSSQQRRNDLIGLIENWEEYRDSLPRDLNEFDWKTFQLDYRDYIDLAKLAQLIPIVGAGVGAIANYRLTELLGKTAMNAYRLRFLNKGK
ncbi:EcsC family protein [Algoriphagus halophytocola]|uniref:EcsC family protein n=1 Tax=Algoriphagus halophytocola TaxID=2991499 RepID=A0ABY6MJF4_9BACT|nr:MULTISPECIES: EcsC family protein [unclassified Algoriphagus]UZD22421.1 EcsC family protein [Algoriphagus sp. TR-M5]WBL43681.1 EcsC family protein [Algoriphagus sp. TR-M9]